MSMQLPATDPYSILHANCWGNPNKESDFIKRLSINVPTENNLSILEKREVRVLDFGSDCLILPDRTSKVLIRDEYIELWKHVEEECHSLRRRFGGVVLTGHPGIGKSFGLYFYLLQNLLAAQPIALQTDTDSFFLFVESGAHLVRFTSNTAIYDIQSHLKQLGCMEGMIALVDSSEISPSPAPIFSNHRFPFYIVQATAPRPSRWKDWVEQSSATVLVMEPWSWHEIFIGSSLLATPPPTAELHDICMKYGPVPRVCFHLAGNGKETRAYERELRREHVDLPPVLTVVKTDGFSEAFSLFSSTLLMIPNGSRLPLVRPISRHIIKTLASRITVAAASEMCGIMQSEISTKNAGQDLFQTVVLQRISEGNFSYNFKLTLIPPGTWQGGFELRDGTSPMLESSVITFESMPKPLPVDRCFFFSKTEGIRSYDAVIHTSKPFAKIVHLLKVVADHESPVFLHELDRIAQNIPNVLPRRTGWTSPDCWWRLVFIVPASMRDSFARQPFEGVGKYRWEKWPYFAQVVAGV